MGAGSTIESMSMPQARQVDVLRWPVVGPLLRWRHARTSLQLVALLIAAILVAHGLFGSQIAPNNLATVVTWVHYRGLLVIALLAAGNLFCTGCPFVLVRDAGRRVRQPSLRWPHRLRTKWIGILLFVAVLFTYELFDLWALPRSTAVSRARLLRRRAVGRSRLRRRDVLQVPVSDWPVQLRGVDGVPAGAAGSPAGDVQDVPHVRLHQGPPADAASEAASWGSSCPSKVGNLDCTFCLDCVQACPHDNVALAVGVPGAELLDLRRRSGIGRLTERRDIAALAVLFAFGGLLNAFAMTAPAFDLERWLAARDGRDVGGPAARGPLRHRARRGTARAGRRRRIRHAALDAAARRTPSDRSPCATPVR